MKRNIQINLIQGKGGDGETADNLEELKKLDDILNHKKANKVKRKKSELYLLNEDIERLHKRYDELFKQVKESQNLTAAHIEKECDILSQKYDFEIEELSKQRKKEYFEAQAKIKADDNLQIPFRRGWWWKLIFQPTTNRAQDIIERRAVLEAEEKFAPMEKELDELAEKVYTGTGKTLSNRKRQRLMKKYLKLRNELIADTEQGDDVASGGEQQSNASVETHADDVAESPAYETVEQLVDVTDVQSNAEPPEPPARKARSTQQTGANPL